MFSRWDVAPVGMAATSPRFDSWNEVYGGCCSLFADFPATANDIGRGLAIVCLRGGVGLVLYHSVSALIVGLAAGAILYLLAARNALLAPSYEIRDYSYAELTIDCAVLGSILWIYVRFIR